MDFKRLAAVETARDPRVHTGNPQIPPNCEENHAWPTSREDFV